MSRSRASRCRQWNCFFSLSHDRPASSAGAADTTCQRERRSPTELELCARMHTGSAGAHTSNTGGINGHANVLCRLQRRLLLQPAVAFVQAMRRWRRRLGWRARAAAAARGMNASPGWDNFGAAAQLFRAGSRRALLARAAYRGARRARLHPRSGTRDWRLSVPPSWAARTRIRQLAGNSSGGCAGQV